MKALKNYITYANFIGLLVVVGLLIFTSIRKEKTAYVDLDKVFNSYKYKIQVEGEYNKLVSSKRKILDSLEMSIISAQNNNEIEKADKLKELYYFKQNQFDQEQNSVSGEMTKKIWSQLTQFTTDFAHQKGYTYVFGGNGDGSLMFADESKNITDEVIEFVNNKYEGENK